MRVSRLCKILVVRPAFTAIGAIGNIAVIPGTKNRVKRFAPFPHYLNKWKTSRCAAMSHGLGSQPGNPRLGSNRVPEPKGKRLRRFVDGSLLHHCLV